MRIFGLTSADLVLQLLLLHLLLLQLLLLIIDVFFLALEVFQHVFSLFGAQDFVAILQTGKKKWTRRFHAVE